MPPWQWIPLDPAPQDLAVGSSTGFRDIKSPSISRTFYFEKTFDYRMLMLPSLHPAPSFKLVPKIR
jgi:hypothetical protein